MTTAQAHTFPVSVVNADGSPCVGYNVIIYTVPWQVLATTTTDATGSATVHLTKPPAGWPAKDADLHLLVNITDGPVIYDGPVVDVVTVPAA